MIGYYRHSWLYMIRLHALCSLIFFAFCLLTGCQQSEDTGIAIRWDGKRATGLAIPKRVAPSVSTDSLSQLLSVRLANKETTILGNYKLVGDDIVFQPLIPFTRGLSYTVWLRDKRLGDLTIPLLATGDNPALLAIYPSQDSLPDNLLKIYLHFSRPMQEGQSQKYVAILKNNTDTLPGVFLNLQPELWNADRTVLTLWLDPGRIKRDLQPNKRLGAPLQVSVHYRLVVSSDWPDQQGAVLGKTATKSFITVQRDSLSPNPARWTINQPQLGSVQPLEVTFGEALDYSLLIETLHVSGENGKTISGTWQPGDEEKRAQFKPTEPWRAGQYRLRIEGRLEDLAGNNLNRPFDRDVTRKDLSVKSRSFVERVFSVR
jgi:hypothetical protein